MLKISLRLTYRTLGMGMGTQLGQYLCLLGYKLSKVGGVDKSPMLGLYDILPNSAKNLKTDYK